MPSRPSRQHTQTQALDQIFGEVFGLPQKLIDQLAVTEMTGADLAEYIAKQPTVRIAIRAGHLALDVHTRIPLATIGGALAAVTAAVAAIVKWLKPWLFP